MTLPTVRVDHRRPLAAQPGVGHNRWHPAIPPVLEVGEGEAFTLETIDSSDAFLTASSPPEDVLRFPMERLHPLTGPVHVRGVRAGDVLEVELLEVEPRGPGIASIAPGEGLLGDVVAAPFLAVFAVGADGYARSDRLPGVRVPARPFPGTIGVAPSAPDVDRWRALAAADDEPEGALPSLAAGGLRTLPPWPTGGNVDIPQLVAGSRLHLPVRVDGALLSVGDLHVAQGAGELGATAIETAGAVTLRCRRLPGAPQLRFPSVVTTPHSTGPAIVTSGLPLSADGTLVPDDLRLAARNAALDLLAWLRHEHGLGAPEGYLLLSIAADLEIAQLVNAPCPTVTCSLPLDVFG